MTQKPQSTLITNPWDVATIYAASFGLFAPGLLMAARRQTIQTAPSPLKDNRHDYV